MYEVFEELMKARGLRPADVSIATGIGQNTLSDWKNGKSVPKADKLQKIANFFGVTIDYLMTGEEPTTYNLDDDTVELLQQLRDNKEFYAYMSAGRKMTPEQLKTIVQFYNQMKETNPDG